MQYVLKYNLACFPNKDCFRMGKTNNKVGDMLRI